MRRITISVLSLFVMCPVWANGRLPVVNIASGGVSARAAFGENISNPVKKKAAPTRRVVARAATSVTPAAPVAKVALSPAPIDRGENIIASNDVLLPMRPSSDLWAQNDTPLRMPNVNEFAVIRSDAELPEESIDGTIDIAHAAADIQKTTTARLSEIDAQIARLNELQKRADNSVRTMASASVQKTSAPVRRAVASRPVVDTPASTPAPEVKLSRMVVPMDDVASDVVVRSVRKNESPRLVAAREDMTKMTPAELRRAFRKTFMSENKHLSTFQMDDGFDVASDMSSSIEGFTARRDLSETGGIRPLEIKIKFRNEDAALSRDNYNLLTEYAGVVLSNPTRAIQITIPQSATVDSDARKLAARRLAIMEQALRDTGVSEHRIMPVLSGTGQEDFVLRMISLDQYESLSQQKRDIFGDMVGKKKTYKSMSW